MRRLGLALLASTLAACGADEAPAPPATPSAPGAEQPAAPQPQAGTAGETGENRPPLLESVELRPDPPTAASGVSLLIRAQDPDRDAVSVDVAWYRNGLLLSRGPKTSLEPGQLARGDEVYARVYASDGASEVSLSSAPVRIANQAPVVTRVAMAPERISADEEVAAVVDASDADGDALTYAYRWFVNQVPQGDPSGGAFPAGRVKRGDTLAVLAQASDGSDASDWIGSSSAPVANAAPRIESKPSFELGGEGVYQYAVKAMDPDGDQPLRYELKTAPKGMEIDLVSGVVHWTVPEDVSGTFPVEIAVSDPYGGTSVQRYSLELRWEGAPAATP